MADKRSFHIHLHFPHRLYFDASSSSSSASSTDDDADDHPSSFPATKRQEDQTSRGPPQVRLVPDYSDTSEDDNENESARQGSQQGGVPSTLNQTLGVNSDDPDPQIDDKNEDSISAGGTESEKLVDNPTPPRPPGPGHPVILLPDYSIYSSDDGQDEGMGETLSSVTVQSSVSEEVSCENDAQSEDNAVTPVVVNNQQAINVKQEKKDMDGNSECDITASGKSDAEVVITGAESRLSKMNKIKSKVIIISSDSSSDSESESHAPFDNSNSDGREDEEENPNDSTYSPRKTKRRKICLSSSSSDSDSEEETMLPPSPDERNEKGSPMLYNLRKRQVNLRQYDEFINFNRPVPPLELFSVDKAQLLQYLSDVKLQDCPTSWCFDTSKVSEEETFKSAAEFLWPLIKKFRPRLERLLWVNSPLSATEVGCFRDLIRLILDHHCVPNLKEITLSNVSTGVTSEFLMQIVAAAWKKRPDHLTITSFKISSMCDKHIFDGLQLALLSASQIYWRELQIRDGVVDSSDCWRLLANFLGDRFLSVNLKSFDFHGGCKVESSELPANFVVTVPTKDKLEHLGFRIHFSQKDGDNFINDIKRTRPAEITSNAIPQNCQINTKYKTTIKFLGSLPKLKSLVLGSEVEFKSDCYQKLPFSYVKQLETFHCASQWHLKIHFPSPRANTCASNVTSLQLPDCLRDPSYIPKIASFFPNVTRLTVNLPSVSVLRSFFHHFSSSKIEELILRTQFDFDLVLDSVLFPRLQQQLNETTKKKIDNLKAYKYSEDFIGHFCIELPEDDPNQMTTKEGVGELQTLRSLTLQHIPRDLRIPHPEETKMWDEESCVVSCPSTSSSTYFISKKTHDHLLQLHLHNLNLVDIQVSVD